eukprot:2439922-Alexandrium_andersonii.AAC.1
MEAFQIVPQAFDYVKECFPGRDAEIASSGITLAEAQQQFEARGAALEAAAASDSAAAGGAEPAAAPPVKPKPMRAPKAQAPMPKAPP